MKKFFSTLILFSLLMSGNCAAKIIHATGEGTTKDAAIHNAMRAAIEQQLGAFVDAKTITKNHQIISDEIKANSAGFISSYEIISAQIANGVHIVTIKADVNSAEVQTRFMSRLQKKAVVNINADSPRVAVLAYDSAGNEYAEVENEILSALQRQGFSRIVDLAQVNRSVKNRMSAAANDPTLRKILADDFHIDYLVLSEVKFSAARNVTLASRLISVNTGKIIYAGNTSGNVGMFTANADSVALTRAAKFAGIEISNAALNSAAKVEQHITLLITAPTFQKIGGTLTAVNDFAKNIDGVHDAYIRKKLGAVIELDVDFDGTAADFAAELERAGFKIIEVTTDYIKI